ncbi:hypothetical protein [Sulfitobacter sp.]|uniref:hypothetical protein n=1 Tax=Sulfitobacter sp. TaxID=1903071 RepID=UPI0030034CF2
MNTPPRLPSSFHPSTEVSAGRSRVNAIDTFWPFNLRRLLTHPSLKVLDFLADEQRYEVEARK